MRTLFALAALALFAFSSCDAGRATTRDARTAPAPEASDSPRTPRTFELGRDEATALLCHVLDERDLDCDRRVTIDDDRAACAAHLPWCPSTRGKKPYVAHVHGHDVALPELYQTSQLVQELVLGIRSGAPTVRLELERVRAKPGAYLERRIEEQFWDALTRRIDPTRERLLQAAADPKLGVRNDAAPDPCSGVAVRCAPKAPAVAAQRPDDPELFVYYPASDPRARDAFRNAAIPGKLSVGALPSKPTTAWLRELTRTRRHGLLTLALDDTGSGRPFVVPGGRFNELYGWDSFFIVWGLVHDPTRIELARSMVDNQAYEITHYGKILNANRTYYLTRSQPPFFTSSIREVWSRLPATEENRRWLSGVLGAAIAEYRNVWSSPPRRIPLCDGDACLARYFGEGNGEPPEVEPGHFDGFYQQHAVAHGHCEEPKDSSGVRQFLECVAGVADGYRKGKLVDPLIDEFFKNDACMRESGHDTTYRFKVVGEERCIDFATVDLNSLLFKVETDIATLVQEVFGGKLGNETTKNFCRRAESRALLVRRHLWDEGSGLFFDYDVQRGRHSGYVSATTLYPLWASAPNVCGASLVTPEMAAALRKSALRELEGPGGLYATAPSSLARVFVPVVFSLGPDGAPRTTRPGRQWEAPNGWAPHQMLAWAGLRRHGFVADAERLAYLWLGTIVRNAANYHGTVPEKFDVKSRSHRVFAEYGNVNTTFSYIAEEGFGWMNASFVVGWNDLDADLRAALGE
jgi:alpha,alpha-trehalase